MIAAAASTIDIMNTEPPSAYVIDRTQVKLRSRSLVDGLVEIVKDEVKASATVIVKHFGKRFTIRIINFIEFSRDQVTKIMRYAYYSVFSGRSNQASMIQASTNMETSSADIKTLVLEL
ncbi:hypothetical protein L1987_49485 [Smallanthus sonchifolius]|uniref:Uncharacterized protein n=1 Tax=Smallanthus sonchifolius TaxID=185202 RepID=A0ACB9FUW5_9ASTR|nr:hypothetical protein L1987_49485 [Smallanthus sonchifolius]